MGNKKEAKDEKKKRSTPTATGAGEASDLQQPTRKRGRPRKVVVDEEDDEDVGDDDDDDDEVLLLEEEDDDAEEEHEKKNMKGKQDLREVEMASPAAGTVDKEVTTAAGRQQQLQQGGHRPKSRTRRKSQRPRKST